MSSKRRKIKEKKINDIEFENLLKDISMLISNIKNLNVWVKTDIKRKEYSITYHKKKENIDESKINQLELEKKGLDNNYNINLLLIETYNYIFNFFNRNKKLYFHFREKIKDIIFIQKEKKIDKDIFIFEYFNLFYNIKVFNSSKYYKLSLRVGENIYFDFQKDSISKCRKYKIYLKNFFDYDNNKNENIINCCKQICSENKLFIGVLKIKKIDEIDIEDCNEFNNINNLVRGEIIENNIIEDNNFSNNIVEDFNINFEYKFFNFHWSFCFFDN
jgi:hypothetical protein